MGYLTVSKFESVRGGCNGDGDCYEFTKNTDYSELPVFYSDPDLDPDGRESAVVPRSHLVAALAGMLVPTLVVLAWLVSSLWGP